MVAITAACKVCGHESGVHRERVGGPCVACEQQRKGWACGMTQADIVRASHERPGSCWRCGGSGEVWHPRWGAADCPADLIVCPECGGGPR